MRRNDKPLCPGLDPPHFPDTLATINRFLKTILLIESFQKREGNANRKKLASMQFDLGKGE